MVASSLKVVAEEEGEEGEEGESKVSKRVTEFHHSKARKNPPRFFVICERKNRTEEQMALTKLSDNFPT